MSFVKFSEEDSVINNDSIVAPLWTGGNTTLNNTSLYTSSAQENSISGDFYLNVYNAPYNNNGAEVQFSIAYGHISGSGSATFNDDVIENTPTRSVYGQFRNLVYGDENSIFNFGGNNGTSRDIYVLNINRSRYKENLKPGSLSLRLNKSPGMLITLTDDSKNSSVTNFIGGNRVYNLVSGSNGYSYDSASIQTNSGSYGFFFPDMGLIILNPRALAIPYGSGGIGLIPDETSSTTYTSVINANNAMIFKSLFQANNFSLKSQETISSKFFFVYAKSGQFNYTTNPSIIDNNGNVLYPTLIDNPQTYITTVGLYDDSNELLAVAKLSKPLPKDFTKTLTLRVRLEF